MQKKQIERHLAECSTCRPGAPCAWLLAAMRSGFVSYANTMIDSIRRKDDAWLLQEAADPARMFEASAVYFLAIDEELHRRGLVMRLPSPGEEPLAAEG